MKDWGAFGFCSTYLVGVLWWSREGVEAPTESILHRWGLAHGGSPHSAVFPLHGSRVSIEFRYVQQIQLLIDQINQLKIWTTTTTNESNWSWRFSFSEDQTNKQHKEERQVGLKDFLFLFLFVLLLLVSVGLLLFGIGRDRECLQRSLLSGHDKHVTCKSVTPKLINSANRNREINFRTR